ncbi:MAG: DUF5686 family protein [Bacteroidales bacterium]|nr:DUF5686 family protein [Bacteroidales bacterium]
MRRFGLIVFLYIIFHHAACAQWTLEQRDSISEVVIASPEDPALAMIRNAANRLDANSIQSNSSFQYIKYQKVNARADTISQDLFLNESVTSVQYLKPNRQNAKVIASKTAGFQNPMVSIWLAALQNEYFDDEEVILLETRYLNPISLRGLNCYDYHFDQKIIQQSDTLLHITFAPKKQRNFSSLRGELWLHCPDFALQRITAEVYDSTYKFPLHLDCHYQQLANGTWGPDSFFVKITYHTDLLKGYPPIDFFSRTTFRNIVLNPPLSKSDFQHADVQDALSDKTTNEQLIQQYRSVPITPQEVRAYELIDSISHAAGLDKSMDNINTLSQGCVAIGPISLNIADLIDYREVEGWRLGLGLYTNERLSKRITFGGHFAYGFRDKQWKYGGMVDVVLMPKLAMHLTLQAAHDLFESGAVSHNNNANIFLSADYIRQWLVDYYDYGNRYSLSYQLKPAKWLTLQLQANYGQYSTGYRYHFQQEVRERTAHFAFNNFETRFMARLAFKEREIRSGSLLLTEESPYPVLTLHYTKGFQDVWGSNFDYHKIGINLRYCKNYKNAGYTAISLWGGYTPNDLPASLLYSPMAAYAIVDFDSWEQFATMHSNDFLCDRYLFAFLRHNFGKITANKKFSPQLILCHNMAFGKLTHTQSHQGIKPEDLSRGYFESGIILDHLVEVMNMFAMGVGVFYHYGPYYKEKVIDNFAIKIRFSIY